ncbi:MAG: MMPL family transporter [Planctomycetota bacterium]
MRRLAIYVWPILLIAAAFGWTRLQISGSIEHTLGRGIPSVDAMLTIQERFQLGETARVLVSARDDATPIDDKAIDRLRDALAASAELEALGVHAQARTEKQTRAWLIEQVPRGRAWLTDDGIESLIERLRPEAMRAQFERHRLRLATPQPAEVTRRMLRDPLSLRDLIPTTVGSAAFDPADFEVAQALDGEASARDELTGEFSADRSAWRLNLTVPFSPSDRQRSLRLAQELDRVFAPSRDAYPGLRWEAAGGHLMAAEAAGRVKGDVQASVLFAACGMTAVFLVVWRRPQPIVLLLTSTGAALFTAFGLYGWTGLPLSPLAALAGGMLAGLGIDYGIHVIADAGESASDRPDNSRGAAEASRRLACPIVIACATTACGFLALLATEPAALLQLAVLGALGLGLAALSSLTLLPAMERLVPIKPVRIVDRSSPVLSRVLRKPVALRGVGVALLVALGLGYALAKPSAGGNPLHDLHPQPNPVLDAQQRLEQTFGDRQGTALVLLEAEDPEALHQKLEAVHALDIPFDTASAAQLLPPWGGEARNADRLAGLEASRVASDLKNAARSAGFSAERFDEAAGFLERFLVSASPTLSDLADSDAGPLFFATLRDGKAIETVAVLTPQRPWTQSANRRADLASLQSALRAIPGARATGLDLISDQMRRQLTRDLLASFAWSAIPITFVLAIGLRRARRVVVTLVTPAAGLLAALLMQRLGSGQWNVVTLAAVPLLLGICVDASLLLGDACARGSMETVRRRLGAIHLTFVTTLIGFGSLVLTSIPAVRELGVMVIAGLCAALATVWLFGLPEAAGRLALPATRSSRT